MVALVGANLGAGQPERARRIALVGGAIAFAIGETVGLAAALWPEAWLRLFGSDEQMLASKPNPEDRSNAIRETVTRILANYPPR